MDDITIIKRIKADDEGAIELLIDRYSAYLSVTITNISNYRLTVQDIEEILADVFFMVWKKRAFLKVVPSLKPYLAQIARNMTISKLKKEKQELFLEDEAIVLAEMGIEEFLIQKENLLAVEKIIQCMKSPSKELLEEFYFQESTLEDIADKYDMPLSSVKSKIYRGRKVIIKQFKEGGYVL